jgi:hypothetical protein
MATAALSASANEVLFLSESNTDPGPAPVGGSSTVTINSLGSHTLYIWVTDGTQVTPPTFSPPGWPASIPPTTAYFSYDLGVTGAQASAISLTSASIENPVILDQNGQPLQRDTDWNGATPPATVTRWGAASHFTSDGSHVSPSSITGLDAITLPMPTTSTGTPTGVDTHIHTGLSTSPNDLYAGAQPGYNAAAHAFLLGDVTFTVNSFNSPGDTILHILPSSLNTSTASAIGYSYPTGNSVPYGAAYVDLSSNFNLATDVVVYLKGDFNHDGEATVADVSDMLAALPDLDAYESGNSLTPTQLTAIGDVDSSGAVDNTDMQGLINLVANSSGSGMLTAVPEPATWSLLAVATAALVSVGRRRRVR